MNNQESANTSAVGHIELNKSSPIPLYFQIARQLADNIIEGHTLPGSMLEPEVLLAKRLKVSRPTVRQAIDRLVTRGLVVRHRGIGTVVVPRQVRRPLNLTSLFDDLEAAGRTPTTRVLLIKEKIVDPYIARAIGSDEDVQLLCLERIRLADDEPLAILRNYLPIGLVDVDVESLQTEGLYTLLRRNGLYPQVAEQSVGARLATPIEARLLHVTAGFPLVTVTRTAYDASGRSLEHGQHCYRADRYSIEMNLLA